MLTQFKKVYMNNKHPDIELLEKRLKHVLSLEQYEIAVIIHKWINELKKNKESDVNYRKKN